MSDACSDASTFNELLAQAEAKLDAQAEELAAVKAELASYVRLFKETPTLNMMQELAHLKALIQAQTLPE